MLAPPRLRPLAQLILTLLTIHMTSSDLTSSPAIVKCPTGPVLSTLEDDHDVPRAVVQGVIDLFGEVDGEWKCDVRRLVAQIGLGLVQALPAQGVSVDKFLSDWKAEVGDMWEGLVDLKLLEVGLRPVRRAGSQSFAGGLSSLLAQLQLHDGPARSVRDSSSAGQLSLERSALIDPPQPLADHHILPAPRSTSTRADALRRFVPHAPEVAAGGDDAVFARIDTGWG